MMQEMSPIPTPWQRVTLKECCVRPDYGYTASASNVPTATRFLRITDIQDGRVEWDKVPYVGIMNNLTNGSRLVAGDIVIARIGATTGKAFLIHECPQAVFASYLIRVRAKSNVSPEFLNFFFQSADYWNQINQRKGGRLKGGVNIPNLESLSLLLPPLPEQQVIARTLQTIQDAKDARQHELELEREGKGALMEHLFTCGTRGEATKKSEIGEIPESWPVKPLFQIADLFSGGTPSKSKHDWWKGWIPWVSTKDLKKPRLSDVSDHITEEAVQKGSRLAPANSLFIGIRGMILAKEIPICLATVPMAFNQDVKAVVPHEGVSPDFLLYATNYFKSALNPHVGTSAHGTRRISGDAIAALGIPIPSADEQTLIAEALTALDEKIIALEKESMLLSELFNALLQELMTGEVSVEGLMTEARKHE